MKNNRIRFRGHLREASWVGKSQPVIKNTFESVSGDVYVIYSTAWKFRNLEINQPVLVEGDFQQKNQQGTVLRKAKLLDTE